MGVEPTGAGSTDAHTVLKTGEATGPHPPPRGEASVALVSSPLRTAATIRRLLNHGPSGGLPGL